jgi:membrane associated rhomboid family serine protease
MKKKQLINKRIFNWGLVMTALVTLPPIALGLSCSDFFKGFGASLVIWLLIASFLLKSQGQKQSLLTGFIAGEVIIVIPILSTYWILLAIGVEEFVAGVFGFLVSLVAFSITNTIVSIKINRAKRELTKLELASKGLKTIEELQQDPRLHQ